MEIRVEACLTAIYNNLARHGCQPKPLRIRVSPEIYQEYLDGLKTLYRDGDDHVYLDTRVCFKLGRMQADPNLTGIQSTIFEMDS